MVDLIEILVDCLNSQIGDVIYFTFISNLLRKEKLKLFQLRSKLLMPLRNTAGNNRGSGQNSLVR